MVQHCTNSRNCYNMRMAVTTPKGEHHGHILFGIKRQRELFSDFSKIERCASLQLHTIYMFQIHYTVTFCGNCVYLSSPSILMIAFLLKLPNAILRKISLIAFEACSWLASFLTVTISCFGSLN